MRFRMNRSACASGIGVLTLYKQIDRFSACHENAAQAGKATTAHSFPALFGTYVDAFDVNGVWCVGNDVGLKEQAIVFDHDPYPFLFDPVEIVFAKTSRIPL